MAFEFFGPGFDAVREMKEISGRMSRLFGPETLPNLLRQAPAFPALNLWETAEDYRIEAEVPGMNLEDVEVLVHGNEVTIKGERKPVEADGKTWHRRERGVGRFERTATLPLPVDAAKVEASLKNGVLLVRLPKAEETKPRKINVTSA